MQKHISPEEIKAAARQLARSEQGRQATRRLVTLLGHDDLDLDLLNQRAFLALLGAAWAGRGAEVRAAADESLRTAGEAAGS